MSEEQHKILEMVGDGKISVEEAEKLLGALASEEKSSASEPRKDPGTIAKLKYLRVLVEPNPDNPGGDKVNIRVPLNLIRAGLKLAAIIPKNVQGKVDEALSEQGLDINLDKITPKDLEELMIHLNDLTVDVEGKEKIRIFCE